MSRTILLCLGSLVGMERTPAASGAEVPSSVDKSGYHLFNPTPVVLLRDLSTDRPDKTESAYTVDAGHFQVELDFANYAYDREGDIRSEAWSLAPMNLKVGLHNQVDLQLVLEPQVKARIRDEATGFVREEAGFGDLTSRLKINLWGNDGGPTALSLMPFVKWPLPESEVRNGRIEGGLIVPFAMALPGGWSLGAMAEFDAIDDGSNGYDLEFVNTLAVGHDITGPLAGYMELISVAAPDSAWQGLIGLGLTYGLSDHLQLDGGCNFGITRSAPDVNPFMGISWRY